MPRPWQRRHASTIAPFDLECFVCAAGFRLYPYAQDQQTQEITGHWWDAEQVWVWRRIGLRGMEPERQSLVQ
jgi:hypothetical protein